ncbi:hypothetical protein BX600DRAFT_533516 [Xylariales sp. PMI_506]|nr:hypothetical protein BX600DRAFT_533516 [Xylariales sp. PMI_506]
MAMGGNVGHMPSTSQDGVSVGKAADYHVSNYEVVQSPITSNEPSERATKEFPVNLKGSRNIHVPNTSFRWRRVHHYKKPGYVFDNPNKFRHRDFAGRVCHKPLSDRYLHHDDGYLRKLIVQTTDEIYEGQCSVTWLRTWVRKQAPLKVRIATWVIDFSYDPESWNDWWVMIARAFPAAIAMTFIFWDSDIVGVEKYGGCYAPVPYRFHGDAKVWSNHKENLREVVKAPYQEGYQLIKPRHLCFLKTPQAGEISGVHVLSVAEWEATEGKNANLSYLFVAYSTEQFNHSSEADMIALHDIAEHACREAGLPAYWIAASCMRDERELENDVYRIADILRGAQELTIAVGQPSTRGASGKPDTDNLLRQWGSRMWTFPEVLLCPSRHINVYTRNGNLRSPLVLTKNQFAARVWEQADLETSRQLVDHFLGSLNLSRLELAVLLLRCLYKRQTTQYLPGDHAYALMGLLRMRPKVDRTDSPFQAFARLSLANDSDQLLERYVCTLPLTADQPWHLMTDAYDSSLWDITPTCQIAAICDDDTVILDGAHGASIRWKSFYKLCSQRNLSWKRWFASIMIQWNGFIFVLSCIFFAVGAGNPALIFLGVIGMCIFLYFWFMMPKLVRVLLGGKFTDVQAALFGVEGHLNCATIERTLFGGNFGRMSWSVNGSPLSRSVINEFGEREGIDPAKDPVVLQKIQAAKHARPGDMRIFTLVDTYSMELTLFEAVRPPVCVFLCAAEGGMQRAVACSYDWTTQTMYRETVLRMPTTVLNRMGRVPRVRLGIQRPFQPVRFANALEV